jgi:sulfopyruvate decarboxylase subunit beta
MTMQRNDVLRAIADQRQGSVAVATMTTLEPFREASPSDLNVGCVGFMGGASPLGLGLALSHPERRVLVLDGDGSLLMQLGSLATIAGAAPPNFYHFLFHNGVYETSGSQPIPSEGKIDFAGMARAAGYRAAVRFEDLEDLRSNLASVLDQEGPVFIELIVEPAGSSYRGGVRSITFEDEAQRLKNALAK